MSETDDIIDSILASKRDWIKEIEELTRQSRQSEKKRAKMEKRVSRKWAEDGALIAEILKDFERRLAAIGLEVQFSNYEERIESVRDRHWIGKIDGEVCGEELSLTIDVDGHGMVAISKVSSEFVDVQSVSSDKFSVFDADRKRYELLILEVIKESLVRK